MKPTVLMIATSVAALAWSTTAVAQDAPSDETAPSAGLADIIVTAQRKVESAQKAAIAIDVVSPDELANAGVEGAVTLSKVVPSLAVVNPGGATRVFFIRGVGNFTFNGYTDPAVAFNLDGVYQGRPSSAAGAFYDLERIEVLKGPQGTLYGRNATGGAINVLPAKPKPGEFSGYVTAGYGNYDSMELEGAVNLPMGDRGALRVSGRVNHNDGTNQDGSSDEVNQAFRIQMLAELTDNLTVRLSGDYAHQGGTGTSSIFDGVYSYRPGTPASATAPAGYVYVPSNLSTRGGMNSAESKAWHAQQVIGGSFNNPAPVDSTYNNNSFWGVNATVDLKTSAGTLTVIPAYREAKLDSMSNASGFRGAIFTEDDQQFSVEARFQGERVGPIDWLVGGYYFNENVDGHNTINQYFLNTFVDYSTNTKSYAGFGRATAHLSESLRLVGAARYTHDSKSFVATSPNILNFCSTPPPSGSGCFGGPTLPTVYSIADFAALGITVPTVPGQAGAVPFGTRGNILVLAPFATDQQQSFSRVTYRVAAEYDIGPRSLVYASFETGYRSGGFSASLGHEQFKPEFVDAWTIGSKNRFFDNKLQLNIEGYYWKYRDQQVSHFGIDVAGNTTFFTENIGKTDIKGVDVEAQFLVTPTTLLRGNVQYLDSKAKEFSYDVPVGTTPPVVNCPYAATVNTSGQSVYRVDCSGNAGYNSPKWSINLGLEQTVNFEDYKLVFNGDMQYRSNRVIGFEYLAQQNSGENTTFDASLRFGPQTDKWALSAYIRNITDEEVVTLAQYAPPAGNVLAKTYAPPRTYGVRLSFNF